MKNRFFEQHQKYLKSSDKRYKAMDRRTIQKQFWIAFNKACDTDNITLIRMLCEDLKTNQKCFVIRNFSHKIPLDNQILNILFHDKNEFNINMHPSWMTILFQRLIHETHNISEENKKIICWNTLIMSGGSGVGNDGDIYRILSDDHEVGWVKYNSPNDQYGWHITENFEIVRNAPYVGWREGWDQWLLDQIDQ